MTAIANLTVKLKVTDLGDDTETGTSQNLTTPVEIGKGFVIISTAGTTAIQLFSDTTKFALAKIYGVYIKAETGSIYIKCNTAGTTTFDSTTAEFIQSAGVPAFYPINPDNNAGMVIDGSATSASFTYIILGKA